MLLLRLAISVSGGLLLLILFVGMTWMLSHNFPGEGPDTPAARRMALAYSWVFQLVNPLNIGQFNRTALTLAFPVLAYSSVVYLVLSFFGVPRRRNNSTLL